MKPRSALILSTLAGFLAGAALVGGLAMQPERPPERGQGERPEGGPPEDRPRPGQPGGREGPGGKGRPTAIDPARLTRRLEEFAKRLDNEREMVGKVLAGLKEGKTVAELEPQVREALMLANGRPGPQEGGDHGGPRPPQEDRAEFAKVIREADPALADRMEEFQKKRPMLGGRILQNVAPRPGEVLRAKAENPELFEIYKTQIATGLDVAERAFELGDLLRSGAPESVRAKRAELREAVGRSIDIRTKIQEHDLAALVHRVEDLRGRVEAAAADREKNIDAFVNMINRVLDELKRRGGKPGDNPPGDNPPPPEGRRPKDGPRPGGGPPPGDRPR